MLFFCLFQCFEEKEYQTESKRNETFGNVIFSPNVIQETWTLRQERREVATRVEDAPPRARPLPRGPTVDLLHLFLHPHTSSSSHKHKYPAQARVLAHFAAIFDLLAQSTSHKTAWGDCSLVCDSSIGPISFCSSALFIANFCCLGDPVLELACQIYMVPSSSNA